MINKYTFDKWNKVETVRDFLNFIEDPNIDYMNWSNSFTNSDKSGFWIGAKVKNIPDIPSVLNKNFSGKSTRCSSCDNVVWFDENLSRDRTKKPLIKSTELSPTTMTTAELEHHKKFHYGNGYDRHSPTPELMRIADILGFENPSVYINNQPPGALMGRHTDIISCFMNEQTDEFKEQMFDRERRQPRDSKDIWRCFVALDDWHPGQIVNFEPNFWTHWEKGDVLFFNWQFTAHSTANAGMHNRPFLKITGTMKDDQFILNAKQDQSKIKVFDYND